jgi:guanylate kinase
MTETAAGDTKSAPAGTSSPRGLLVVLSGPSGVGKDAILDEFERRGHRFHRVITCTTRAPREGERDGVDYHFVSDAEFDALVSSDALLEHATVYGHRSGVPRDQVAQQLASGVDVYVRTDVQGAATIRKLKPDAVRVFVAPSSFADLEARIRARGAEGDAEIARRIEAARGEMARQNEFEHVIVNEQDRLDAAVDKLERIVDAERARLS